MLCDDVVLITDIDVNEIRHVFANVWLNANYETIMT